LSSNDIFGNAGSLTTNLVIGVQSYTIADVNNSVVNFHEKSHAVVMIIDASTAKF